MENLRNSPKNPGEGEQKADLIILQEIIRQNRSYEGPDIHKKN
jgi:hypothetical protein